MKKTILTLVMMLMVALATQTTMAAPMTKADSVINAKMQGVERVKEKIDKTLDDTIVAGDRDGWAVEVAKESDMTPEQIKAISDRWAEVVEVISTATVFGILFLVLMVLLFRYLTRRRKYHLMEQAIINKYPLDDLQLNDIRRSTVYVQQPVMTNQGQVAQGQPVVMNAMPNWRSLMPAVKLLGWGVALSIFGLAIGDLENPFWAIGLALLIVGLCKGFILYKEQQTLQEAWRQNQTEPMREGIPVPPPIDGYNNDVSARD